jgi:hypothetical protein
MRSHHLSKVALVFAAVFYAFCLRLFRLRPTIAFGLLVLSAGRLPAQSVSFIRTDIPLPGPGSAISVVTADFNKDGKLDLAVSGVAASSSVVQVLLGNGDGTFRAAITTAINATAFVNETVFDIAVGDFNGDGKADLAAANVYGTVVVLIGNGDGTFKPPANYNVGSQPFSVAVGDFNGDGKPDIVTANDVGPPNPTVSVLLNITVSDFTPPTTTSTPSPNPNSYGWNNTNVTVNLNATDNPGGSGVKQIQFALGGAQNADWQTVAGSTASVTISAEGTTILSYFATDNAGNQETAKTLTVRIDKTPPVISGLPAPGCTIWPPNHKLVQIATVTATDALSGLAQGSFAVTVTSSDPANGQILITGGPTQFNVQLGADKDEVYTLTATAIDLAGNVTTMQATCTVPHDQGK